MAIAGALTIAFSSILVRLSHTSPSTSAIFRCVYALPLLALLALREDRRLGGRPFAYRPGRGASAAGATPHRVGLAPGPDLLRRLVHPATRRLVP